MVSTQWGEFKMPRASQTIELEGYFAEGVLGIFKIIRGFADLRDLAAVSEPYELSDSVEPGRVFGHQRRLNKKHALDIKKYLEQSNNRLIPEIILSVRGTFNNPRRDLDPSILCKAFKGEL